MRELSIPITHVKFHPESPHENLIKEFNWIPIPSKQCVWSDGKIGGFCCEFFIDDLEVGNLVHPLGNGVDVGFGLERLIQVLEGKDRVDETSIFDQSLDPVSRDHIRTLRILQKQGIQPSSKGPGFVCRTLVRRIMRLHRPEELSEWIQHEQDLINDKSRQLERYWNKLPSKPLSYWKDTHGFTLEDLERYLNQNG